MARKSAGLTQKAMAERAGCTQADISRLENGEHNVSLRMLTRVADALGVRLVVEFCAIDAATADTDSRAV